MSPTGWGTTPRGLTAAGAYLVCSVALAGHRCRVRDVRAQRARDGARADVAGTYRGDRDLQQIVYERLAAARRIRLHRAIGGRLEQLWSAQAREHAMELAVHFERGQDIHQATSYLWRALSIFPIIWPSLRTLPRGFIFIVENPKPLRRVSILCRRWLTNRDFNFSRLKAQSCRGG